MWKLGILSGAAAVLAGAPAARADHILTFEFYGTITLVEGSAPVDVHVGGSLMMSCTFDSSTPDAESAPAVGSYPAISSILARISLLGDFHGIQPGPISVIDNSALGDRYAVSASNPQTMITARIDLIDAQSGAVSSDAIMTDVALDNYDDEFDVATITIESTQPGATWRVVGAIDVFIREEVFCRCDWNRSHSVNSQDFFDFMTDFFSGGGDYNFDGITNTQDFFDFLSCLFFPCP